MSLHRTLQRTQDREQPPASIRTLGTNLEALKTWKHI